MIAVGLLLVGGFNACADSDDCSFAEVDGLTKAGDSTEVTIEVVDGEWPPLPFGPGTGYSGDDQDPVPAWAPDNGAITGVATLGDLADLSVDFGDGRIVVFRHTGCF